MKPWPQLFLTAWLSLTVVALIGAALSDSEPESEDLTSRVEESQLKITVDKLVGFGTRHSLSTHGKKAARDWLGREFATVASAKADAMVVYRHDFADSRLRGEAGLVPQENVYAVLKGRRYPDQAIIFGAHYDSLNLTDSHPDAFAPGANDNASGTAAILEAARVLNRVGHDRTLIFVAFAAEEQGLIGSRHFASFIQNKNFNLVAMINNDIIGGAKDERGKPLNLDSVRCFSEGPQDSDSRRLARAAKLVVEKKLKGLRVLLQDRVDRPGRGGDHQSFSRQGIPAIRFIETNETDHLHHTALDTADRLHAPYHALVVKADVALLENLASGPSAPSNIEISRSGRRLHGSWQAVDGATGYLIGVRRGGLEFDRIVEVGKPSLSWRESSPGRVQISVASVDRRGRLSLFSREKEIVIE
jgi:hypothetical protein